MSYTVDIALYAEPDQLPNALASLVQRLLARGQITKATIDKIHHPDRAEHLATTLSPSDIIALAQRVINGRKELLIDMVYDLAFGGSRGIGIELCTVPIHSMVHGALTIWCSYNDLSAPFKYRPRNLPAEEEQKLAVAVWRDAEELFFRSCGLSDRAEGCEEIEHAKLSVETWWLSPVGSAMVFHKRIAEFARDFARIYAEYHWGVRIPATLPEGSDLWDWEARRVNRAPPNPRFDPIFDTPYKDEPQNYNGIAEPVDPALLQFLSQLSESQAQQLSELPEERIRDLLKRINGQVPDVVYHDFADCGGVLSANPHPLSSLWPAYAYIAEQAL